METSFTVVLATSKGNKIAGVCTLDLGSLLNNKIVELTENYRLEKCPDKNAKIFLKIKTSFLGEVKDVDAVRFFLYFNNFLNVFFVFSQFTDISKMNDSFEALTSQNLEGLKESLLIDKKKNIEELTINKNSINLDNSSVSFNGKERDKLIETVKNLEEKSKLLQNENNELLKNFNKIVIIVSII